MNERRTKDIQVNQVLWWTYADSRRGAPASAAKRRRLI